MTTYQVQLQHGNEWLLDRIFDTEEEAQAYIDEAVTELHEVFQIVEVL